MSPPLHRTFSRREAIGLAAGAVAFAAVAGCSDDDGDEALPAGDGRLRVLNWEAYIDEETVPRFEEATGTSVSYSEDYIGNAEALADIIGPTLGEGRPSGYDVMVPTYWVVDRMVRNGWVEPVPIERVPNHVNVDPAFLTMPWDRGARFHMPWQVGITGIAYDAEAAGRELGSIDDLFDRSLAGRVGFIGEMREAVGLAMLRRGADPARATASEAEAALDDIAAATSRGQVAQFTFSEFTDGLLDGSLVAAMAWSGDIVQLQAEHPERDIRFVIPEEGAIRWFDSMVIPAGATSPGAAADWMDFCYDPINAARITQAVQYISPVLGVREELDRLGGDAAALAENPILFPDDETRRRLFFWSGLDADVEDDLDARFAEIAGF